MSSTIPTALVPFICQTHLEEYLAANKNSIKDDTVLELVKLLAQSTVMQPILIHLISGLRTGNFIDSVVPMIRLFMAVTDCLIGFCMDFVAHHGKTWRKKLRRIARQAGYKIHDYRRHKLQMPNGNHVNIISPWYVIAKRTGGRRKCGPKKPGSPRRGRHLALEIFGFFNDLCPTLAFKALSLSVLCPSMAIASTLLKEEGICLSQNKIRSLFETFDDLGDRERVRLSCKEGETLENRRVCILIDGGRIRERLPKKGPIPKEKKRRPFETKWRAPLLFTIFVIDDDGKMVDEFPVLADGILGGWSRAITLLKTYLEHLHADKAKELIIIGDGDENIWDKLPPLVKKIARDQAPVIEILDYYHAVEYLHDLFKLIDDTPLKRKDVIVKEAKELLFKGEIQKLYDLLVLKGGHGSKRELKKRLTSYFLGNAARMRYQDRKDTFPIGSGQIESAIRSVINLRIKSPSTFWMGIKAETMIFLRSKLLYGRWHTLKRNWINDKVKPLKEMIDLHVAA